MFFTSSGISQFNVNAYNITTDALKWAVKTGAISNDTSRNIAQMQIWNNQLITDTQNAVYTSYGYHQSSIISYNGYSISALDINTGQQKWNYGVSPTSGLLIVNSTLYTGILSAVDLYTGKQKWSKTGLCLPNFDGSVSNMCVFASGKAYSSHIQ